MFKITGQFIPNHTAFMFNASFTTVIYYIQGWGPRARGQLEDPKSWPWPWPWPLTVPALALASKWSGLGLDASASSHRSVINVLNL